MISQIYSIYMVSAVVVPSSSRRRRRLVLWSQWVDIALAGEMQLSSQASEKYGQLRADIAARITNPSMRKETLTQTAKLAKCIKGMDEITTVLLDPELSQIKLS